MHNHDDHSHGHHHHHEVTDVNKAFIIGIVLNVLFVIIEAVIGFQSGALSLLSDAGHNLSDVISLILSLTAFKLAKVKPTLKYTYGFKKSTILASLANALLLLVAIGGIAYEAVLRFSHPQALPGNEIAVVAAIGILINGFTAWLFMKGKDHDLNVKGAYLHMAADALVSLGVVIGGIAIIFTGWYWLDSVISLLIAAFILFSTWSLLKDSVRLSLDGVPGGVDYDNVKKEIQSVKGVKEVHHIHIWAISTTENALTAHIVLEQIVTKEEEYKIKKSIRHKLEHHLDIGHVTIETECDNETCSNINCS